MKDKPPPTPEAVERVKSLGEKAIVEFLDEVKIGSYRQLSDSLPNVPGFRKSSTAGIKKQKQILAKRLTGKTPDERDHRALYAVWRSWASERLGDSGRVDAAFARMEATGGKTSSPLSGETVASETPAVLLFSELKKMSAENLCSQEDIRRFFEFSPFSAERTVVDLINESKSASDIEKDSTIKELPKRLRRDEEEIQALRKQIETLSQEVSAVKNIVDDVPAKINQFDSKLTALSEDVARLLQANDDVAARISANREDTSSAARSVEELRKQVHDLSTSKQSASAVSSEQLSLLKADIEKLATSLAALSQDVLRSPPIALPTQPFEDQIASLTSRLNEIEQLSLTELTALTLRIDTLEGTVKETAVPPDNEATGIALKPNATLLAFPLDQKSSITCQKLSDLAKVVESLVEALQWAGLKKSAAQIFAEDIVAALSCKQVVFFKGSLSSTVASACANALSAGRAWSLSVPVGLTESSLLRATIRELSEVEPQEMITVVFEGINRASLDVAREALLATPNVALFATVLDGLAALPIELAYFEHGPIFDLDCLEWRARLDMEATPIYGNLSVEANSTIRKALHAGAVNADEPLRLLKKYLPKRNIQIERTFVAAYVAISHVRMKNAPVTALHSLAFGWLAPLWMALGLSVEEADSELDGGKLDAASADLRIAEQLKAGDFSRGAKDGGA